MGGAHLMEIPRDDVLTKKMIQGYPSFRGPICFECTLFDGCLMETGYLWLFLCFKYWILVFLAPKLFESSMNAHAGFGTLWERGSLKDGPLWKILYKPIQPREIIKKSRHPDTISSNVGNRIIPSSSLIILQLQNDRSSIGDASMQYQSRSRSLRSKQDYDKQSLSLNNGKG